MTVKKAVLDANVLFPMTLRDTLLRAAESGLYQPFWTDEILGEVRRNLVGKKQITDEQAQKLLTQIRQYFPESLVTDYHLLIDTMQNDPKDRHVLAAAVKAGADSIVTDNIRDFPQRALEPHGIEAQNADTFLCELFSIAPDDMLRIVQEQAADRRAPPKTAHDILNSLAKRTPLFAALARKRMMQIDPMAD